MPVHHKLQSIVVKIKDSGARQTFYSLCLGFPFWKVGMILYVFYRTVVNNLKKRVGGNSLVVQWLGFSAFTSRDPGSTPGRGTKIPQAGGGGCEGGDQKKGGVLGQCLT